LASDSFGVVLASLARAVIFDAIASVEESCSLSDSSCEGCSIFFGSALEKKN